MKKILILFLFYSILIFAQNRTPGDYWEGLTNGEKISFINGAFSAGAKLKYHHKQEVKKQYRQDINWREPYYIERFYIIVDEHRSQKAGYDIEIIAKTVDAFYSNYDNNKIPVMEALRIVSLGHDGNREKANIYLLKAQRRYKP